MQRTIQKLNQEINRRPQNDYLQKQLKLIQSDEAIIRPGVGELDILREEDLREQIREKYRKKHLKDVIESVKDDLTNDDHFIANLSEEIMVQVNEELKHNVQMHILQETEKVRVHVPIDEISEPLIKKIKQELISEMKQEINSYITNEISKQILPIRNQVNRILSLRSLATQESNSIMSSRTKRKFDFEKQE